jgi:transcriptional regulator with XRE-family HTH domain
VIPHPLLAQLADERRRRGLSQAALADRAGLSRSSVEAWENGALPTLAALQCLLDALGMRVVALPADEPIPVFDVPAGEQIPFGQLTVGDGEKWCGCCRQVRSRRDFHTDRSRRDGLTWRCRFCAADLYQRRKTRGQQTETGAA